MSWSLLVLCLAALGMVAAAVSAMTALALPVLDRAAQLLAPRHRTRVWLWASALPLVLAGITVLVTLLPSCGFASEHCLAHDLSHPYLCLHHFRGTPGAMLIAIAAVVVLRGMYQVAAFVHSSVLSSATSRTLREGSEPTGDVLVFEDAEPRAFVLGVLSPVVHASRGLLAMRPDVVAPVLAHERAHVRARDALWRALCPVLSCLHLPWVARALARRLATAQEMAADAEAADELGDPVLVAESLLALAQLHARPVPGLAFTHGDVAVRVRALVGARRVTRSWPGLALAGVVSGAMFSIAILHEPVHHTVETLLGVLS